MKFMSAYTYVYSITFGNYPNSCSLYSQVVLDYSIAAVDAGDSQTPLPQYGTMREKNSVAIPNLVETNSVVMRNLMFRRENERCGSS